MFTESYRKFVKSLDCFHISESILFPLSLNMFTFSVQIPTSSFARGTLIRNLAPRFVSMWLSNNWFFIVAVGLFMWTLSILQKCVLLSSIICNNWLSSALCLPAESKTLLSCHNGGECVSNHQPHECCLLNRLVGRWSKKTSTLRVAGLCAGYSPETGEISAQMASNAENVSIWWRHHEPKIHISSSLSSRLSLKFN